MSNEPIIKEILLNAPASEVWKAITDKEQMKQWYFDFAEFRPEVGFEFQFYGGDEKKQWLHLCKITEVVTGKKLTYSWRYDGYAGISYVTFELFPARLGETESQRKVNKTRLKLTHKGLETFPADVKELGRENFVEGWNQIIGTSLKEFVEKSIEN
jgi:uncharacterized protein YndB with AHSA1/START domain